MPYPQHTASHPAARWADRAIPADGQGHRSIAQKRDGTPQHAVPTRFLPTGRDTAAHGTGSATGQERD